jgi:hypothetical protein
MAVSVLPNVAIIVRDPNPVLASEAGTKVGSARLVESRLVVRT